MIHFFSLRCAFLVSVPRKIRVLLRQLCLSSVARASTASIYGLLLLSASHRPTGSTNTIQADWCESSDNDDGDEGGRGDEVHIPHFAKLLPLLQLTPSPAFFSHFCVSLFFAPVNVLACLAQRYAPLYVHLYSKNDESVETYSRSLYLFAASRCQTDLLRPKFNKCHLCRLAGSAAAYTSGGARPRDRA